MNNSTKGFTLIELLIALMITSILVAIAVPSYQSYVIKSQVKAAQVDLVTLSAAMENVMQLQLQYPTVSTTTTADTKNAVSNTWAPSDTNFIYTVRSTNSAYLLTAQGIGNVAVCQLTVSDTGDKTINTTCPVQSW